MGLKDKVEDKVSKFRLAEVNIGEGGQIIYKQEIYNINIHLHDAQIKKFEDRKQSPELEKLIKEMVRKQLESKEDDLKSMSDTDMEKEVIVSSVITGMKIVSEESTESIFENVSGEEANSATLTTKELPPTGEEDR